MLKQDTFLNNGSVIILLLFFSSIGLTQETRQLYFDSNWQLTSKDSASYTRLISIKKDDLQFEGAFTDTNKDENLITKGYYANGKKQGVFIFNYEDGTLNRKGEYINDKPMGIWEFYYPNGQLHYSLELMNDDFKVIAMNDENGLSRMSGTNVPWEYAYTKGTGIQGSLSNGLKNGDWKLFENGNLIGYQVYKNGKYKKTFEKLFKKYTKNRLISNLIFTPLYLTYSERLELSQNISKGDYPFLGNLPSMENLPSYEDLGGVGILGEEVIMNLDKNPLFRGGKKRVFEILRRNIRSYKELDGISSRVFVEFYIDEDGDLYQVKIIRSDDERINEEALRLAKLFSDWKPAQYQGKPISSKVTLPLKLSFKSHKN